MCADKTFNSEALGQFTGSEAFYRYGLKGEFLFTDGVKYVADAVGAYWLLDEITLAQRFNRAVAAEEFQLWTLKVAGDNTALLSCDDGNGRIVYSKQIAFTDFPTCGMKFYVCNSVIMLPGEY
jgi:hypothetical protein